MSIDWRAVHWVLYDVVFYDLPRRSAYRKLRALCLSRSQAIEELRALEREP